MQMGQTPGRCLDLMNMYFVEQQKKTYSKRSFSLCVWETGQFDSVWLCFSVTHVTCVTFHIKILGFELNNNYKMSRLKQMVSIVCAENTRILRWRVQLLISGVLLPSSGFNFSFAIKMACMGEVLIVLHRDTERYVAQLHWDQTGVRGKWGQRGQDYIKGDNSVRLKSGSKCPAELGLQP